MRKTNIPNRKEKRRVKGIAFLLVVFFATISILFSFYLIFRPKHVILISPMGKIDQKNAQFLAPYSQTKLLQDMLTKNNIAVSEVTVATDAALLATLDGGEQIYFSQSKDLGQQIASLQLIIRRLTIEGRRFTRIDFRFDNPIVAF